MTGQHIKTARVRKKALDAAERSNAPKARVLVVDDHPIVRHALAAFLNREADLVCAGEVANAAELKAELARGMPELVLLDLRLGHEDGLESIKSLRVQFPQVRILVVSGGDEMLFAERAMRAGACGYVMKDAPVPELLTAIRTALAGEIHVSRNIALRAFQKSLESAPRPRGSSIESLTDRELQVFELIGAELSTREIAAKLHLSFKTIETYRENIKHKLGLPDAEALVRGATSWVQNQKLPGA